MSSADHFQVEAYRRASYTALETGMISKKLHTVICNTPFNAHRKSLIPFGNQQSKSKSKKVVQFKVEPRVYYFKPEESTITGIKLTSYKADKELISLLTLQTNCSVKCLRSFIN